MPNINFKFPEGCSEDYRDAEMPTVPRVGDYVQGEIPQSSRYRVASVYYHIGPSDDEQGHRCTAATVTLEVTDEINLDVSR